MITVTFRDDNGKRKEISHQTHTLLYHALIDEIKNSQITEEDEVLLVIQDGMCLYCELGASYSITIDDLLAFFG